MLCTMFTITEMERYKRHTKVVLKH